MPQSSHWLQLDAPYPSPKMSLPEGQLPTPTACLIHGPSQPTSPNVIHIQSAIFPQCTGQTEQPIGLLTDGAGDKTCINTRLHSIDCIAPQLINVLMTTIIIITVKYFIFRFLYI